MIIRLSVLFLLISYLLACFPGENWVPTTLEEQVNHSGAIIYGRVSQVFLDDGDKDVIRLSSSIFLKGCGPSINDVDGFTSAASCGLDHPEVDEWVIVFVCRDSNRWILNRIGIHTGMANQTYFNQVVVLTGGVSSCEPGQLSYGLCTQPLFVQAPQIPPSNQDNVDSERIPSRKPKRKPRRGYARRT